jgi:hypothetical protein
MRAVNSPPRSTDRRGGSYVPTAFVCVYAPLGDERAGDCHSEAPFLGRRIPVVSGGLVRMTALREGVVFPLGLQLTPHPARDGW